MTIYNQLEICLTVGWNRPYFSYGRGGFRIFRDSLSGGGPR